MKPAVMALLLFICPCAHGQYYAGNHGYGFGKPTPDWKQQQAPPSTDDSLQKIMIGLMVGVPMLLYWRKRRRESHDLPA